MGGKAERKPLDELEELEPIEDGDPIPEEEEKDEAPALSPAEEKASQGGWVPKDQWVENGGSEEEWRSAREFNDRGEIIGQLKELQRQGREQEAHFTDRLANVTTLHKAQQKAAVSEVERKLKEAVDVADTDEAMRLMAERDELNKAPEVAAPAVPKVDERILEWRDAHPWIKDEDDPRSSYGQARWTKHLNSGMTVEDGLDAVLRDVEKHFPPTNPNRDKAPRQEGPTKAGKRRTKVRSVGWDQLTAEEQKIYNETGDDTWGSKDNYLQAVADDRSQQ